MSTHFTLSRATASDLPEIHALHYKCFPPLIRKVFMGCKDESDIPRLVQQSRRTMETRDPHDIWIKVVDGENGRVVAASNWKIYLNGEGEGTEYDEVPEWLEGEEKEASRKIFEVGRAVRMRENPGGFLQLHICFTDPDYRRRGAGAMMLRWGCDLADQLFLPGWIEASPEGSKLYQGFGFYLWGEIGRGLGGVYMKRDPRAL